MAKNACRPDQKVQEHARDNPWMTRTSKKSIVVIGGSCYQSATTSIATSSRKVLVTLLTSRRLTDQIERRPRHCIR